MRIECGWCGLLIEADPLPGPLADEVSHGVCDACARRWLEDDGPRRAGSSSSRRMPVTVPEPRT